MFPFTRVASPFWNTGFLSHSHMVDWGRFCVAHPLSSTQVRRKIAFFFHGHWEFGLRIQYVSVDLWERVGRFDWVPDLLWSA